MVKKIKKHIKKNRKTLARRGFTFIELMVVISIMSFMASTLLVTVKDARTKSRDAKRVSDINALAQALEFYYDDNHKYPSCHDSDYPGGCDLNNYLQPDSSADSSIDGTFLDFLVPKYISKHVLDPVNSLDKGYMYVYGSNSEFPPESGQYYSYLLGAVLEEPNNPALNGSLSVNFPLYKQFYVLGQVK